MTIRVKQHQQFLQRRLIKIWNYLLHTLLSNTKERTARHLCGRGTLVIQSSLCTDDAKFQPLFFICCDRRTAHSFSPFRRLWQHPEKTYGKEKKGNHWNNCTTWRSKINNGAEKKTWIISFRGCWNQRAYSYLAVVISLPAPVSLLIQKIKSLFFFFGDEVLERECT